MKKRHSRAVALALSLALAGVSQLASAETPALQGYGADLKQASVSGLSSGGFMAAQLATAYSSVFKGVGIIAAGPYDCASTFVNRAPFLNAVTSCMSPIARPMGPDAKFSWSSAQRHAQEGSIDPVANLARQRVYIFSGSNDPVVKSMVVDQVDAYYRLAGVAPEAILYRHDVHAGHALITAQEGDTPCAQTQAPYLNNCGFSQAQEMLHHLAGAADQPASTQPLTGEFVRFDQREFDKDARSSMDDSGYAYIPRDCRSNACAVHVALHGCQQAAVQAGERFYKGAGYNEYADANRMIVLYPQMRPSSANPLACWDFWGYSSPDPMKPNFQTRQAPQMAAIMAMVRRLGEPRH